MQNAGVPAPLQAFPQIMLAIYALLLLVAYVKHRRDLLVRTIDHLFFLIILVHLVICVLYSWVQAYITLIHGGYDDSPAGDTLCQVDGILTLELAGNAVTVHVLVAIERWMTVVLGVKDTPPTLLAILAVVEVLFAAAITIQLHSVRRFEPAESGLYCFFPSVTQADSPMANSLIGTKMLGAYCGGATVIILSSYAYIYVVMVRSSRRTADKPAIHTTHDMTPRGGEREQRVFYRCVGVVAVFACTYLLEFSSIVYELMANAHVPGWIDALAATLSGLDAIASPVMMLLMNKKVAEAAAVVVGVRLPPWMSREGRRRVHPTATTSAEPGRSGTKTEKEREGEEA
ncbi:hypothetical protein HK101_011017 [Irineochytrium annulatum]|nr:hypothetical protein HK101_011017 [Irineochytrium annulatum]